jgi:hypothetical protein
VVALGDDREATAVQPVDQPHLPHRLRAVEALREDTRGERAELLLGTRLRKRRVAHVVVQVEVGVVDPDGAALAIRDELQLLAEPGDQMQPGEDVLAQLADLRRGPLEDRRRGDVHMGRAVLEVEEGRIEPGQAVAGGHAPILP